MLHVPIPQMLMCFTKVVNLYSISSAKPGWTLVYTYLRPLNYVDHSLHSYTMWWWNPLQTASLTWTGVT